MRLIDADALKDEYERIYKKHYAKSIHRFVHDIFRAVFKRIDNAPTIEAEPVRHGRWVDKMVRDWHCSECGKKASFDGYCYDDKPNYCPHCGARMDGEHKWTFGF